MKIKNENPYDNELRSDDARCNWMKTFINNIKRKGFNLFIAIKLKGTYTCIHEYYKN